MASLFSKLLAGGLSAGVFLLWWPRHFPEQGLEWLVLRGVLWTLSFEVLHAVLAPLERRALGPATLWLAARRPRRTGWIYASAALALVVPGVLLTDAEAPSRPRPAAAQAKVVRQVIVKRQRIVQKQVVVREVRVPVAPDRIVVTKTRRVEVPAKTVPAPAPKPEPEAELVPAPETPAPAPAPAPTGSSSGSSQNR